jgi:hypothetical protein
MLAVILPLTFCGRVSARPETSKYNKQLGFLAARNRNCPKRVEGPQRDDGKGTSTACGERMTSSFPQSSAPVNFPQFSRFCIIGILFA